MVKEGIRPGARQPVGIPGSRVEQTNPFTGTTDPLGVVGTGYHPLQNEEHAQFLNQLADESGAIFATAGSLRGGRQVFVTMRLPKHLTIGGTDRVERAGFCAVLFLLGVNVLAP